MSHEDAVNSAPIDATGDSALPASRQQQHQPACRSTPAAMLLYCSYLAERTDPRLKSLLLWTDPRLSGAALAGSLALLCAIASRSFISVLAYVGLAALMCASAMRLYRFVRLRRRQQQQQHQASGGGGDDEHTAIVDEALPLRWLMHSPVQLPREQLVQWLDRRIAGLEQLANYLLCLMLCRDPFRTLKLFCCLIGLTYIGAWMNASTLIGLALIGAFSLPKLYSMRHAQIDSALANMLARYRTVNARIRAAIPFGKEKAN